MAKKLLLVAVATVVQILVVVGAVIFFRNTVKLEEVVRIEGHFQMALCEDCLDMEVIEIEPQRLSLIVGDIIAPYSAEIELAEVIYSAVNAGESRRFCLTGRLHRYREWQFFAQPPYAYPFLVETIDQKSLCFP